MYPDVFVKFARNRQTWGDVEVLPTPQFYYGMERGADITVELEPGKSLAIKFLTVGEPHPDGTRTVFFELNGQPREVTVRDTAAAGFGLLRGRRWAWWLAIGLFGANGIGDLVSMAISGDRLRSTAGALIAGAFVFLLVRRRPAP
jgi:pyruvate carboxylase